MISKNIESYYTIIADKPRKKTSWISMVKIKPSTIKKVEIMDNLLYITTRLDCGISVSDNMTVVMYFDDELEFKRIYNDLLKFVN